MAKDHWEIYFDAIRKQNWDKALNSLEAILKKESKNPQVYLKIGDVLQKTGDVKGSIDAYHQSAWLTTKQGFSQKALAIFKIILRLDPDNVEAINKSKELMMEIEGSKVKSSTVPYVGAKIEEEQRENAAGEFPSFETGPVEEVNQGFTEGFEPASETKFESGTKQEIEAGRSEKMEDFFERSLTEDSLTTPAPEIQEKEVSKEKQETETPYSFPTEDESIFCIPSFLSSVPEDEARDLIGRLEPQSFLHGQKIIEEGDSGDSIYVIKSGEARVVAHILGKEIELATLSCGDVFGEVAFLTGRPRTASVIAVDKLEIMEFNRLILEEIFEKYPDILKRLGDFYQSHMQDTLKTVRTKIKK
ncbi:MAG: cyclic nucleotide-binding domain-containing protein [Nitrospirae bacterium]|nr:cyclic nucleotide-binding domain-containing protein [Nitrospirota bacterium]